MKMGSSSGYYGPATPHSMTGGLPQTPRQKGRPRKRKPKDIEAMTTNLGEFIFSFVHHAFSRIELDTRIEHIFWTILWIFLELWNAFEWITRTLLLNETEKKQTRHIDLDFLLNEKKSY